uniref:NADH-ubiquinone oxidoreductase chain 5 n=1 Tax=Phallusia mammillata TaxID=59560 RepID=A7WL67_9ASCI|nr:NADH dehydrogenase subunit 5 [Phallusia mammillata]CAL23080.2 NADH dehydrogenase subunit 5 [Phallusia mammillata]
MLLKWGLWSGMLVGVLWACGGVGGDLVFGMFLGGVECSFLVDFYSLFFMVVACYVTLSIMSFSGWYMAEEPAILKFTLFLGVFLLFMLMLVFAGNLMFLMIGWEGVGIMSFLLISWWSGRSEASVAGVSAIIYNRVGDFGLYLALFALVGSGGALSILGDWGASEVGGLVLLLILVGAMAKSSQFLFHPWLPSAMEGPTPVSSLLHSSTMVVAGVFVLIRLGDLLSMGVGGAVLLVGALTMLYGAACAYGQEDMKKVVAFSTTSQLGLMVCSLGLGYYLVAFFHMCMHAFFKSLIFISSGVFIHSSVGGLQDMRGGGLSAGFSFLCLMLGSLSLGGFPFFAGFFSKDSLLENMYGPVVNRFGIVLLIMASVVTVGYSLKLAVNIGGRWSTGSVVGSLLGGVENGAVLWFMLRLVTLGVGLGFFMIAGFGICGEEYLWSSLKVVPLGILFAGLLLGWLSWGGQTAGIFMYSYNPLIHRMVVSFFLKKFCVALGVCEFWLWEGLHIGGFARSAATASSLALSAFGGGLRSYFAWVLTSILLISCLMHFV